MSNRFESALKVLAVSAAMAASAAASAQSAGTLLVKVGIDQITPQVSSGDLSAPALPGTKAAVGSDTKPIFSVAYMFTDHISVEAFGALPFKHELSGAGSIAGTGKIGSTEVLPPTVLLQYRFMPATSKFRPYVGAGLTYAYFQKETGSGQLTALTNTGNATSTTFKLDGRFGATLGVGATFAFKDRWFADLCINKTFLKTSAKFSTGQTMDIKLDPVAVGLSLGYAF